MKKLLAAAAFLIFLLPSLASAAIFCPNLTDNLSYRTCDTTVDEDLAPFCIRHVSGTQVVDLQHFLTDMYRPATNIMIGYFGVKTRSYVIRFQNEQGLPATGFAGPLTRAAIAQACTGTSANPPTCEHPAPPAGCVWQSGNTCAEDKIICSWNSSSCRTPWGAAVLDGQSVTAYQNIALNTFPVQYKCISEVRYCQNSVLSGIFTDQQCREGTTPTNPGLSAIPTSGAAPLSVRFTMERLTVSGAPDGYSLDFGDSTTPFGTRAVGSVSTSHTYAAAGTYTAILYSLEDCPAGCIRTEVSRVTVQVTNTNTGSITFSASPTSGSAPLAVGFHSNAGGTLEFGDGTSGSMNPAPVCATCAPVYTQSHTYATAGTYTAKLTRTTAGACDWCNGANIETLGTVTITVTGGTTNNITFSASPTMGNAPLGVTFTMGNLRDGEYSVQFGDGQSARVEPNCLAGTNTGNNSSNCPWGAYFTHHTYSSAGTFTAKLYDNLADCRAWVTDCSVASATVTVTSAVTPPPPPPPPPPSGAPSITFTSPQPGTPWAVGEHTVSWTSANPPTGAVVARTVTFPNGDVQSLGTPGLPSGSFAYAVRNTHPAGTYTLTLKLQYPAYNPTQIYAIAETTFVVGGGGTSASNVGSCTYKGTAYAEGQTVTVSLFVYKCDNRTWTYNQGGYTYNACDNYGVEPGRTDLGCGALSLPIMPSLAISPARHGNSPLTITAKTGVNSLNYAQCGAYTLSWGDGKTDTAPIRPPPGGGTIDCPIEISHAYTSAGSYTINFSADTSTGTKTSSANIRVDSGSTGMAPNNSSQLASALTALEVALNAIRALLVH